MDAALRLINEDWHLIIMLLLLWMIWAAFKSIQRLHELHDQRIGEMMLQHSRDREQLLKMIN